MSYLLLFLLSSDLYSEDIDLNDIKSRYARSAVSAYQRKVEAAAKDYEKVATRERSKLIDELEDALKKETNDGNLDEAVKLKAAIESLKQQSGINASAAQHTPQIEGIWRFQFTDGVVRYQTHVLRNGQSYALRSREISGKIEDEGALAYRDGKVYVKWKNFAIVERYTLDGDRMLVEHWNVGSNSSIDRFPTLMCIATKVEEAQK